MLQKASPPTWIVAFLGNPGLKYELTRHNAGWFACSYLENKTKVKTNKLKFHAFTNVCELGGERVLLMRPQTYMNLSGDAVAPAARFYKIPIDHIIAVHDDTAIAPGRLRIKRGGSDGGHNGIKSLTQSLGSSDFPRVKIGVGSPPHPDYDMVDWVIGKLSDSELKVIAEAAERAAAAVEEIIKNGTDKAMNKYNGS
jgi:PTH1 family peptidyl-tRNA hydrolase